MSGENRRWHNPGVDHRSDSGGPIFRTHQYAQPMQHASPSTPGSDEMQWNFILAALLDNSQLRRYHSIVSLYISLDDASFQSIYQLRVQSHFQQQLSSHHASLYGDPPPDIWHAIVQLRYHSTWPHSQTIIADALTSRMVQDLQRPQRGGSGGLAPPPGRRTSQPMLGSPSGSSESSAFPIASVDEYDGMRGQRDSSKSPNPSDIFSKRDIARTAPQGQCWRCPSQNCKKTFVKMGHLKNHLSQIHPDYLACHSEYEPDDYLEPLPPSRTPSDETRLGVANRSTTRTDSQGTIVTSERSKLRHRTPSFTPSSTSGGSKSDFVNSKSKARPGINRTVSDSGAWPSDNMINEFEHVSGTGYGMGVQFPSTDPFQQPFYAFDESGDQHMEVDTRHFSHRPSIDEGHRGGPSSSPGQR